MADLRSRAPALWALAFVAAGVVLVVAAVGAWETGDPANPRAGAEAPTPAPGPAIVDPATPVRDADDRTAAPEPAVEPLRIRCLEAASRAPLAGVHLYRSTGERERVAGPSDADGVLEVDAPARWAHTLWCDGWLPVAVPKSGPPAEVLFESADASLELRLANTTAEHEVIRLLLQPHTAGGSPKDPWVPALEPWSLDVYGARRLPPGKYDVHVWVSQRMREPRAFSVAGVEVRAGEQASCSVDLAAPIEHGDD
jgi:hypothetical protein